MLRYFVRRSSGEAYQKVETPPKDNVWIHGESVRENELRALSERFDLDFNILRDVMDEDELPRVEAKKESLYVFVRTALRNKQGRVVTRPLLLAVKGTVFVNVSAITTDSNLAHPTHFPEANDTNGFLLGTLARVVNEYEDLMKRTGHYIRDTAQRLKTHEVTNDDFVKFVTVEDNLNEYLMNLNAMLVVAERLKETMKSALDIEAIEDILLYIRQLIVAIESHRQSITSIQNAYRTIANNVLNQRMKTLTVLTVLIAIPNVFYGMYGMNVALPFQQQPWAYGIVFTVSVIVVLLVYVVARKKGVF